MQIWTINNFRHEGHLFTEHNHIHNDKNISTQIKNQTSSLSFHKHFYYSKVVPTSLVNISMYE